MKIGHTEICSVNELSLDLSSDGQAAEKTVKLNVGHLACALLLSLRKLQRFQNSALNICGPTRTASPLMLEN